MSAHLCTPPYSGEKRVRTSEIVPLAKKKRWGQVYTPVPLIRELLDHLPEDIWMDPTLQWLDPAAGTGHFVEFVYAKLMITLVHAFPDELERNHHILGHMLFMVEIDPENVAILRQRLEEFAKGVRKGSSQRIRKGSSQKGSLQSRKGSSQREGNFADYCSESGKHSENTSAPHPHHLPHLLVLMISRVLIEAVLAKNVTRMASCLEDGAPVDSRDDVFCLTRTTLRWAAFLGSTEMVTLLLAWDADVYATDDMGRSAADLASREGHLHVLQVLMKRTAATSLEWKKICV